MSHRKMHRGGVVVAACAVFLPGSTAPAQPGCRCDFNQSGAVNSQDFFDYLNCFFSADPLACGGDFDGSGAVNSQDFFDFLNCFFTGCPAPAPSLNPNPHTPPEQEPAATCSSGCTVLGLLPEGLGRAFLFSGEFYETAVDLRIRGRGLDFVWARKYRSRGGTSSALGNGWDHSYNISLEASGANLVLHNGWARSDTYLAQPDGSWSVREFFRRIVQNPDTSYTLTFADMGRWNFRPLGGGPAPGRISSIVDRNDNTITFAYDGQGRLDAVTDTLGRSIDVHYDADGRIDYIEDFTLRRVVYQYYAAVDTGGSAGDLRSVRSPTVSTPHNPYASGKTTVYTYSRGFSDDRLNHNLLTITDPRGNAFLRNTYNPTTNPAAPGFDQLTRMELGDPGEAIDLVYLPQVPSPGNNNAVMKAVVEDQLGHVRECFYDDRNREVMLIDPALFETRWTYNNDSLPTRVGYPRLNFETLLYDEANPSVRARGSLLQHCREPGPAGGAPPIICEQFQYLAGFGGCCGGNFVTMHTDGNGNVTQHSYDARGNRVQTIHPIVSIVENWTYNAFGQVVRHILPRNGVGTGCRRVDTYAYHTVAPQTGYLQRQIVDASDAAACAGPHFNITTQYTYDARGNPDTVTDPSLNTTNLDFNELDQLVRQVSPPVVGGMAYEKLLFYDAADNLVRTDTENRDETGVRPAGNTHFTTITDYEILNNPVRVCSEVGGTNLLNSVLTCAAIPAPQLGHFLTTAEYTYDACRNRTLVRHGQAIAGADPFNVIAMSYDQRDLLFQKVRAPGSPGQSTDQYAYDGNGNLVEERRGTESAPRITTYAYDGYDRRARTTDPLENVTIEGYDGNGNVTSHRIEGERLDIGGNAGNVRLSHTTYAYDALDRRTRADVAFFDTQSQANILDGLSTTTTTYTDLSAAAAVSDDNGHTTTYSYDTASRLRTVTDAAGNSAQRSYDDNANTVSVLEIDVSSIGSPQQTFTTAYQYDSLNRLVRATDNLGNFVLEGYDSRSNRVLHTDERGNRTRYVYDGLNRLIQTIRDMDNDGPDGVDPDIVVAQAWDASSRLVSQTDDNGNATTYAYDALDRLVRTTYADTTQDNHAYDVHDNRTQTVDANGSQVASTFDLRDRLTGRSIIPGPGVAGPPNGTTTETYQYDGLSRLVRAQDDDSTVTRGGFPLTNGYNSLGDVLREIQQITSPAAPASSVRAVYDGVSNQTRLVYPSTRIVVRTYSPVNLPLLVSDDPPGPGTTIATYAYIGHRVEVRDNGNGVSYQPAYDGLRRITRTLHTHVPTPRVVDDRSYTWDAASNKLSATNPAVSPGPDTRTYTYDAADRLVQSAGAPYWPNLVYTLDGAGNRTAVAGGPDAGPYTCNSANPPADCQVNQYTVTGFDSRQHDGNGNLLSATPECVGPARQYVYDYRNQLVQFTDPATGITTTYKYDCFGRRIQKSVGATISRHSYDGDEEIEEQSGANLTVATYVHSKGPGTLLGMNDSLLQRYFFHEDDLMSVVKVTDANGVTVQQTEYHDFGKPFQPGAVQSGNLVVTFDSDSDPSPGGIVQHEADDFWLPASAQISSITFRGGYDYTTDIPPAGNESFQVLLYQADPGTGLPGSLVYQQFFSQVPRSATGRTVRCNDIGNAAEFEYIITPFSPIFVQGNTRYWLAIVANTSGFTGTWGWETSDDGNGRRAVRNDPGPWFSTAGDLAFQLATDLPTTANPFLFAGRRFDAETGFSLFAGYLDPRAGRFTTRAPSWDRLRNAYTAFGANPLAASVRILWPQDPPPPKPPPPKPPRPPVDEFPIEIVALNLVSVAPITVTPPSTDPFDFGPGCLPWYSTAPSFNPLWFGTGGGPRQSVQDPAPRTWPMCPSGSCGESTFRVEQWFPWIPVTGLVGGCREDCSDTDGGTRSASSWRGCAVALSKAVERADRDCSRKCAPMYCPDPKICKGKAAIPDDGTDYDKRILWCRATVTYSCDCWCDKP